MYPEHLTWVSESRKMSAALKEHIREHCSAPNKGSVKKLLPGAGFRAPVIVQIEGPEYDPDQALETAKHPEVIFVHHLPRIKSYAATASLAALKRLDSHQAVKRVWLDRPVHTNLDIAAPAVQATPVWEDGRTGRGVVAAVIDTGIYPHPDLVRPANRIKAFQDLVNRRRSPYDDNGHGTHCAGILAGNGRSLRGRYRGIAPEAGLVGVKVLDRNGNGSVSTVIAGIDWCLTRKDTLKIRIISLSLGGAASSHRDDPAAAAVEAAWNGGLVVVAAAGNKGPAARTIESPGLAPAIITVGAEDDHRTVPAGDDTMAAFSSRGPTADGVAKPDVVAPGVGIISLRVPGSHLDRRHPGARVNRHYFTLSGTSMATPMCAGIAALVLEAAPGLTPDQVKGAIVHSCRDLGFNRLAQGHGLPSAREAVGTARVVY